MQKKGNKTKQSKKEKNEKNETKQSSNKKKKKILSLIDELEYKAESILLNSVSRFFELFTRGVARDICSYRKCLDFNLKLKQQQAAKKIKKQPTQQLF